MMRGLLVLVLTAVPLPLWGQARPLRIEGAGEPVTVALAMHRGYPAYPATALRRLGAEVASSPEGAWVELFGDTLVFETFSPIFFVDGRPQQLVAPTYREGGIVYLPHQFFADWLPSRYPDRLGFHDGVLRVPAPVADASGARSIAAARGPSRAGPPLTRVVIIDAGHGGRDPGRPGPDGLREKHVTLSVAKRLARKLSQRGGFEVHLTRATDTLVALDDRPRLANEWKAGRPAALFVSIHANAASSRSAAGFETFFLSEARTEDERRVAEMENAAVEYEEERAPEGDDLGWILNTLRNDFYLRASNDLAEVVQRRIHGFHPGPNRGVKQAGFRVLVGAFMPAVLVEMAFISNRAEAALLGSASFQDRMADALADAVEEFFHSHEHLWTAGDGT